MKIDKDELTIYEVENLHKELLDEFKSTKLVIDLSNVNKIDMSIIQLLISAKKSCEESSKVFQILGVNNEVTKIFKDSGCYDLLGVVDG